MPKDYEKPEYQPNSQDDYKWSVYDKTGDIKIGTVTTDHNNIHDAQQEAREEYGHDTYIIKPSK